MWKWAQVFTYEQLKRYFRKRKSFAPILKRPKWEWVSNSTEKQVRFRDQCKASFPALMVFSRDTRLMGLWRTVIFCSLVYESWAFPFRLAFNSPSRTSNIFYFDISVDVLIILDTIIRSLSALHECMLRDNDASSESKTSNILWDCLVNLSIHVAGLAMYCISTILLSSESFDQYSIDLNLTTSHWIWWGCTIPRMIIRCRRLLRQLIRSIKDVRSMIHVQAAKAIALSMVLSAHWIGCICFFMARLRGFDRRTWVSSIEETLVVYERFESPIYYQYILALCKGVSSISGVEFTPYLANSAEEQIAGLLMIVVQVYTSAWILGTIIHFFALRDPRAQLEAERHKDLQQFVQSHEIPAGLELRLKRGLEFQLSKMAADNVDAEFDLSRSLEIKVAKAKYSVLIQRCSGKGRLFQGCCEHFLDELVVLFNPKYFMATEEILKKGDISRDLIFLMDGAVESVQDEGNCIGKFEVPEVIFSDVPDHCPCIGEVAFFLGIMQPRSIRAHKRSDVRVTALAREDGDALFKRFPDQRELICSNILRAFDLGADGALISSGEQEEAEREPYVCRVRAELHTAIVRRREESFASLVFAAKRGDLDLVRMMLEGGMQFHRDYDGRTVLAHAARAGVYKVCDVLLDERADINSVNRWGQTPLDEALAAQQLHIVQLLTQRHARIGLTNASAILLEAANCGNVDLLNRILLENQADPDSKNYDDRTPLHLACAAGHIKAVERLLICKANINANDRWGGTPLEDAVASGHSSVAYLLWSKGAEMNRESAIAKLCDAASRGNMVSLRMLRTCRVVDLDCKDYDGRTPLIKAASEGRVLATSYLLSCSCSPHPLDGWGASALDRALQGGTVYHLYCAKLIQSWGGKISLLKGTPEGDEALARLNDIDIDDVRLKLKELIAKGHDQTVPKFKTDYEIRSTFESCMALIPLVESARSTFEAPSKRCEVITNLLRKSSIQLLLLAQPVCDLLDMHPFLQKGRKLNDVWTGISDSTQHLSSSVTSLLERVPSVSLPTYVPDHNRHSILARNLQRTISLALEDGTISEGEEEQIQKDWDALTSLSNDALLQDVDALDAEDEEQLHKEIDFMTAEREYCNEHGLEQTLYRASKFQGTAMRLGEMEEMYDTLCRLLQLSHPKANTNLFEESQNDIYHVHDDLTNEEFCFSAEHLAYFFSALSEHAPHKIQNYEVEEMFEQAKIWTMENAPDFQMDQQDGLERYHNVVEECGCDLRKGMRISFSRLTPNKLSPRKSVLESNLGDSLEYSGSTDIQKDVKNACYLPVRSLIAGSSMFRHTLLTVPVDEVWCLLQQKTRISEIVPDSVLKKLAVGASVLHGQKGQVFHCEEKGNISATAPSRSHLCRADSTKDEFNDSWYVIVSGYLSLTSKIGSTNCAGTHEFEQDESGSSILGHGQCFGAYQLLSGKNHHPCTIKARTEFKLVKLPISNLKECVFCNPEIAPVLLERMAETLTSELPCITHGNRYSQLFSGHNASGTENSNQPADVEDNTMPSSKSSCAGYKKHHDHPCEKIHASIPEPNCHETKIGQGTAADFYVVQCGLKYIEEAWQVLSGGNSHIHAQVLRSLLPEAGEIGKEILRRLFTPSSKRFANDHGSTNNESEYFLRDLDANEFWGLWVSFLADQRCRYQLPTKQSQSQQSPCVPKDAKNGSNVVLKSFGDYLWTNDDAVPDRNELDKNSGGMLLRSIRSIGQRRPSESFLTAARNEGGKNANLKMKIERDPKRIPFFRDFTFLRTFLPDIQLKRNEGKAEKIMQEISRKEADCSIGRDARIFAVNEHTETPRNVDSNSFIMLARILAMYHFFSVPWRISFVESSENMMDPFSLLLFVPVDAFTALYVVARLVLVGRNMWDTDKLKFSKNIGTLCIISALPLDWVAMAVGGSHQVCLWFRTTKLLFCYYSYQQEHVWSMRSRSLILVFQTLAVIHVCCCFWHFIGVHYSQWDPGHPYSWFKVGYPVDDPRYVADAEDVGNGYMYHGLSCSEVKTAGCSPGEHWYYYGMWFSDSGAAKYLLSFYIVCTRVAGQGGDILPQNFVEVVFDMMLILMNLTVFSYVIGELSASVMSFNEKLVASRDRVLKLLNFIETNRLPEDLVNEIDAYCSSSNSTGASVLKCSRVLRYLPHSLQVEVARQVCGNLLDNVCLFRGCSDHFKDFLIISMSTVSYSPDEYIFKLGQMATDIFVVQNGTVEELIEDINSLTGEKPFATARRGQGVGALALFFELRQMYSARASRTSGATCLRLSRERFHQLLKYCPEEEERITENAMHSFQKKFGAQTAGRGLSKTGSSLSTLVEMEVLDDTFLTDSSSNDSVASKSSVGMRDVRKQAHGSIAQIKGRRRALRTHMLLSAARSNSLEQMKWALQGGHIELESCDDVGRSALHVAACEGHLDMVVFLLDSRADPCLIDKYGNSPLNDAVRHHHDAVADAIRQRATYARMSLRGYTAGVELCAAAAKGDLSHIRRLVTNGISVQNVDYDKRTALHLAACHGNVDIVRFLIDSGADVQAKDRLGNSPLDDALKHGHRSVQFMLRAAGARVGWMRNGIRACRASAAGDEESGRLVRALVEMGLDPSACDQYDRTPLHLAACNGSLALLDFLLQWIVSKEGQERTNLHNDDCSNVSKSLEAIKNTYTSGFTLNGGKHRSVSSMKSYDKSRCAQFVGSGSEGNEFVSGAQRNGSRMDVLNAVDRYGNTPLDDAIRRGNSVAALAIKQAGGLKSSDLQIYRGSATLRHARVKWWHAARRDTVAELILRSPETQILQSAIKQDLPLLTSFLTRFEEEHKKLEDLLSSVLHSLQKLLGKLVDSKINSCETNALVPPEISQIQILDENSGLSRRQPSEDLGPEKLKRSSEGSNCDVDDLICSALNSISGFFLRDVKEAQETMSLLGSVLFGYHLQPRCKRFSKIIRDFRVQLQTTCQVMRLLRKIFRSVNTFRISAVARKLLLSERKRAMEA